MAMLIASLALKWVLIGGALVLLWYFLAPLFTPRSLRKERATESDEPTIIEGQGRVIDD